MARRSSVRPRTLSVAFGLFLLFMAVLDWWSATSGWSSSYRYAVDTSRWAYMAYMIVAAVLLSGVGIAALSGMRGLDRRIEAAEAAPALSEESEPAPEAAADPDAVPPPLAEEPAPQDDVDQDIDELLVSLEEIETTAEGETEVTETIVAEVPAGEARRVVRRSLVRSADVERLKERRAALPAYYAGPALASIGIIGICAAVLPGVDSMLQTSYQLNTMLLLGIGYAYAGVALFTAVASWAMLRRK